jgi:hypothetical protein
MTSITEGGLTFDFPVEWEVSKLDEWSFYRNQFQSVCNGTKAIDIMAVEPDHACVWLVEIKDYRRRVREKTTNVADEIARKVRDSLALVAVANVNANNDDEKARAGRALRSRKIRVVLHLEQTSTPSKLYPRKIDLANTQQKLRQLVRAIDPHALLREMSVMGACGGTVR